MNENVGFMAYNVLAGGVLTGKYLGTPAAVDDADNQSARRNMERPRGRMDEQGWGRTLYRYRSGPAEEATRAYAKLASKAGLSLTELALRWSRGRQPVTTSLLGHTSMAQLDETLGAYRSAKPLPEQARRAHRPRAAAPPVHPPHATPPARAAPVGDRSRAHEEPAAHLCEHSRGQGVGRGRLRLRGGG